LRVFKVTFTEGFAAPIDVRAELHLKLYEIASTIGSIPAHHHSAWSSLSESEARLDVRGWQFVYRVDPKDRRIIVLGGSPILA